MRKLSERIIGDNLAAEEVPLAQPLRLGVDVILAPMVYVPDLVGKIFNCWTRMTGTQKLVYISLCIHIII